MSAHYEQRWRKGIYEFARINDPIYGCEKHRVVTTDEENQIDLVDTRSMSVTKDAVKYNYILSL